MTKMTKLQLLHYLDLLYFQQLLLQMLTKVKRSI